MVRKFALLMLAAGLILTAWTIPVRAQTSFQARTHYALTVFSGPDRDATIAGILAPDAEVFLEARSVDSVWVLGHDRDGTVRGWMEIRFLDLAPDVDVAGLHVSREVVFVPTAGGYTSGAYKAINLNDYPVMPATMGRAPAIFEAGKANGSDPYVVSKVGDCISDNKHFLSPFGWDEYNLGSYTQLQPVIDQFKSSLAYDSLAAYDGLVTTAVLDPLFANPGACQPGESPLRCEYRVHQPSAAIIMFGAQDLLFTPPDEFDRNLRRIVHETIQAGVIPIVSTFPGNVTMWERTIEYNQIVVQVALDYDVPLMNLWRALEALPNHGLNTDGRHLSLPVTTSGDLTGSNLRRGYPLRNLVTLQALDAVWRGAMFSSG